MSFAEETCWDGDKFREVRRKIQFRVFSIGRNLTGQPFNAEFESDFGLWYDQSDEFLVRTLSTLVPGPRWAQLVFHKRLDQSGIDIYDPDSDRLVAQITVRKYGGRLPSQPDGVLAANVLRFSDLPAMREALLRRSRESEASGDGESR